MSILVFGNGWIGNKFIERYPEARMSTVFAKSPADIEQVLEAEDPDVVLNCAGIIGRPNVDWCETHQIETAVGNTMLPIMLAEACAARGIHFTHLGSGCIFYGDSPKPGGWLESDYPNPVAYYSKTKAAADFVLGSLPNVAVVRLRVPMDSVPSPKNTITKLMSYPKVIDVSNSVTVIDDLLDVFYKVMEKRATGIFHAVNPEPLKYRDLVKWYEEIVDPNHKNEWISEDELVTQGIAAKKRSTNILANTRLPEIGIHMRPTEEAVKDVLRAYAEKLKVTGAK
ncbi:MAG: sugar nucleotide-binding protein [Patescibacteria group bacterium]|nr:sugar nucleotide-binding protein [Patescibacteria group bacterium]